MTTTWSSITVAETAVSFQNVASDYSGQYLVAVGGVDTFNGVIYTSDNSGRSFKNVSKTNGSGPWTTVASDSTGQNLIAAGLNNITSQYITSSNGGKSWSSVNNFPSYFYVSSVASDSTGQNLIAVGSSGSSDIPVIYTLTNNGGTSWVGVTTSGLPTGGSWTSVASDSTGQNLIIGSNSHGNYFYISKDGGTNWEAAQNTPTSAWNYVASDTSGTYLIASADTLVTADGSPLSTPYIYTSINGGTSWVNQTPAINALLGTTLVSLGGQFSVAASSSGIFFAIINKYFISLSNTGIWSVIPSSQPINLPFMACNQAGNEFLATSAYEDLLITFTSTPAPTKYKTKTNTTSDTVKGSTRLDVGSTDNVQPGDKVFLHLFTFQTPTLSVRH